jgi:hypothetical protein
MAEFHQNFKAELNNNTPQTFPRNRKGRNTTNSFYETSITLIPKPNKDATKKVRHCWLMP